MSKVYIYGLCDPRTQRVRYIGKAKSLHKRLYYHLTTSQLNTKTHKINWIKKLLANNLIPKIIVIEKVNDNNWQAREQYWIKYYNDLGFRLTNGTIGGDGNHKPSEYIRQKIRNSLLGRKLPKYVKLKLSGERNCLAKLTNEQAKQIREIYFNKKSNISLRKLGKKYDVSGNTILDIVHNRRYQDEHEFEYENAPDNESVKK